MKQLFRFLGTIILACVFSITWSFTCIVGWITIVELFYNSSLIDYLIFPFWLGWVFIVYLFPVIGGLGAGIAHLVRCSKDMATSAIIIFVSSTIVNVSNFFITNTPHWICSIRGYEVLDKISKTWYNLGAICTLAILILGFSLVSISMFYVKPKD